MKTLGCAYCCGDLIKVEGILGPESFCPNCRRFQPRGPLIILPTVREEGKPTPETTHPRKPPRAKKRQA